MANKLTKVQKYEKALAIPAVQADADLVELFKSEIESIKKRNAHKSSKAKVDNSEIYQAIVNLMEKGKQYTVSDFIKGIPALAGLTPQKVGPMCRNMVDAKMIQKAGDKKRTMYELPSAPAEETEVEAS